MGEGRNLARAKDGKYLVAGDSIKLYTGEFLISPVPLELTMNLCSHACTFCFANLNKPKRWHDVKQTLRIITQFEASQRKSPIDAMLKYRYPVLISNKVDPFAYSNYRQTLPIIRMLFEQGVPVSLQTRGGAGIDEVLEYLPPSVWYLSFNCWNEKLRKQIEPGAPSIQSRLELLNVLKQKGHKLTVGLNPYVPAWWTKSELTEAFDEWQKAGVTGVWAAPLHLNNKQIKNLTPKAKDSLGTAIISRARSIANTSDLIAIEKDLRPLALEREMAFYNGILPVPTNYFDVFYKVYPRLLPTAAGFSYHLHNNFEAGDTIHFKDFLNYAESINAIPPDDVKLYPSQFGFRANYGAIFKEMELPKYCSYKELFAISWQSESPNISLSIRTGCLSFIKDKAGNKIIDDAGHPVLKFKPYSNGG